MRYRKLPTDLKCRVHEYYYQRYHGHLFDEETILGELSHALSEVGELSEADTTCVNLYTLCTYTHSTHTHTHTLHTHTHTHTHTYTHAHTHAHTHMHTHTHTHTRTHTYTHAHTRTHTHTHHSKLSTSTVRSWSGWYLSLPMLMKSLSLL